MGIRKTAIMTRSATAAVVVLVSSIATTAHSQAQEPFNYAELWGSWGTVGHEAYLEGVVDGTFYAWTAAGEAWLGPGELYKSSDVEKIRIVREKIFVREQRPQIPAVMTDLYSDPANAYIALIDMVFIARDKLEGKDVERALDNARKRALETHRLRQQIKRSTQ